MCQSTFLFRQIKKAELSFYLMKSATSNYALSMILTRRAVLSMMPQYYLWEIKKKLKYVRIQKKIWNSQAV